jgi:Asp-tRNA(Asn)/Glu-tRNA(Gln) amidotransferase B subunit
METDKEEVMSDSRAKIAARWMINDLRGLTHSTGVPLELTPFKLAAFVTAIERGVFTGPRAKEVFKELYLNGKASMYADEFLAMLIAILSEGETDGQAPQG